MGGRGGARPLACLERLWNCAAALLSLRRIRVNTAVEVVCVRVTCCGGECEADPGPLRPSVECRSTFLCGGFVSCCIARGGRGARVRCSFLRETRKNTVHSQRTRINHPTVRPLHVHFALYKPRATARTARWQPESRIVGGYCCSGLSRHVDQRRHVGTRCGLRGLAEGLGLGWHEVQARGAAGRTREVLDRG